jgi:hypothetical protein
MDIINEALDEAEKLELPDIEVGDEVLVGKFKNRKATVKGFEKDDHNQPVLKTSKGDQKLFKPRIPKLEEPIEEARGAFLKLYHFTPMKSVPSVQAMGLDPSKRAANFEITPENQMVYLASDAGHAAQYIYYQEVSEGLLLSVDVSKLDPSKLCPDDVDLEDMLGARSKPWYEHNWKESLRKCGQCGYQAIIPASALFVEARVVQNREMETIGIPLSEFKQA